MSAHHAGSVWDEEADRESTRPLVTTASTGREPHPARVEWASGERLDHTHGPVTWRDRAHFTWALLLVLPLLFGSCICSTSGVNRGDINLVPLEEEWRMGATLEQQLAQELTLVQDPAALDFVNRLGRQLVDETELADREWHFHIVADPTINAFAVPGGHIYIHTGLITAARTPSELAGVVGHEVAHGVARHSTERMTAMYGIDAIASLILGSDVGFLEQIVAQLIGSGAIAKFSRDDEREADRLGLQIMRASDFDPDGMITMFERLLEARQRRPNALERFFSSHPLTEERIENVRAEVEQLPETEYRTTMGAEFERVQARVAVLEAQAGPPPEL